MGKIKKIVLWSLIVLGIAFTIDLIYIFVKVNFGLSEVPSFCTVSDFIDCDGVAQTKYSVFLGIPLAIWGMLLYSLFAFLLITPKLREKFPNSIFALFKNPYSYIASFGLLSFCISMCLALVQLYAIEKVCVMCVGTYFIDLFIALCAKTPKTFFLQDIKNTILDFFEGVKKYTLLFIIVVIASVSLLGYLTASNVLAPNLKQQNKYAEFQKDKNQFGIKGNVLGNEEGAIKVYIFSDFMCPFCRVANSMVHKLALKNKNVSIKHMNFPLDSSCNKYIHQEIHPGACNLALYAIAAKKQDNYWGMTNLIYDNRPSSEDELLKLAKEEGFDIEKLKKDVNSKDVYNELLLQIEFAMGYKVEATPSFVIDDILYTGAMPFDTLLERTKQAYNRHQKNDKK